MTYKDIADVQARRQDNQQLSDETRNKIRKLLGNLEEQEKQEQQDKKQVRELAKQQDQEQRRSESIEQAEHVKAEVAQLEEKYRKLAVGKPWYDGGDDIGAILPFQWRGALFGAGARRWILGDGMGLGKTRQSIGWLDLVQARKVVIVCQADICDQFAGELMTLAPHRSVYNLYKKTPKTRHAQMDKVLTANEAAWW
jgi:SNF2 family DNA or RNA helicase